MLVLLTERDGNVDSDEMESITNSVTGIKNHGKGRPLYA